MGVEPTTYTMRTYRSSQLSYYPVQLYLCNIEQEYHFVKSCPGHFSGFFHEKTEEWGIFFTEYSGISVKKTSFS